MLGTRERAFLERRRVGYLATAGRSGEPGVVPVCFALGENSLYTAVDEKPKRARQPLRRLTDIAENSSVSFLAEHYEEEWSNLGWVMLKGHAEVIDSGPEFEVAVNLLRRRYSQYAEMRLLPVIALRILQMRSWGNLDH